MPTKVAHDGVHRLVEHGGQLVEVLLAKEYEQEHLPGAINIPLEMLNHETAAQLQQHQPVIVYCYDSL
jgi:rhodanese-related sulfurtransferase